MIIKNSADQNLPEITLPKLTPFFELEKGLKPTVHASSGALDLVTREPTRNHATALVSNGAENTTALPSISPDERRKFQEKRREDFALSRAIRDVVADAGRRADLEYPLTYHRSATCRFTAISTDGVVLLANKERAHYGNVKLCGDVWACPSCSRLIQQTRRAELSQGMNRAHLEGFMPTMITLTFPHRADQSLKELLAMQAKALRELRNGRPWLAFRKKFGHFGYIRSLEITYGAINGWHPHTHEMHFFSKDIDQAAVLAAVKTMWLSACRRAGLLDHEQIDLAAFDKHAVDIKFSCSTAEYLAKLDRTDRKGRTAGDAEMAQATNKKGLKGPHKTHHPFELLQSGNKADKARFLEYLNGCRGKRQLLWSPGLKKWAGIHEIDDEQAVEAAERREDAFLLMHLNTQLWRNIRQNHPAQLLDAAEKNGQSGAMKYIATHGLLNSAIQKYNTED